MSSPNVRATGTGYHRRKDELSCKRTNSLKVAIDSKRRLNSSKKGNQTSYKHKETAHDMLTEEELFMEVRTRRNLPNIVARLMGLDSLPSPQPMHKQRMRQDTLTEEFSSVGLKNHKSSGNQSMMTRSKKQQDFKDVFEVMETSKVDNYENLSAKGSFPKLRFDNKINLVSNNILQANQQTIDEELSCERHCNDFDVTDLNTDAFLKSLQGSDPLFMRCIQDFTAVTRDSVISNPLGIRKNENCWFSGKPNREVGKHFRKHKNIMRSHVYNLNGQSICKHFASAPNGLVRSKLEAKEAHFSHPTRIVVLKPSLKTGQLAKRIVSAENSKENVLPSNRRARGDDRYEENKHIEFDDKQLLSDEVSVLRQHSISREKTGKEGLGTRTLNWNGSMGSDEFALTGSSSNRFEYKSMTNTEEMAWNSRLSYDGYSCYEPSPFLLAETSVAREPGKHHMERSKISQRSKDVGRVKQSMDTVGEMLALPERGTYDSFLTKEDCHSSDGTLGISSRNDWKYMISKGPRRFESFNGTISLGNEPEDCFTLKDVRNLTSRRSSKWNKFVQKTCSNKVLIGRKNSPPLYFPFEENEHSTIARASSNGQYSDSCATDNSSASVQHSAIRFYDVVTSDDEFGVFYKKRKESIKFDEVKLQLTPGPAEDQKDSNIVNEHEYIIPEVFLAYQSQKLSFNSNSNSGTEELKIPLTSSDSQQLESLLGSSVPGSSHLSTLKSPCEEEQSSTLCFDKVDADIQALRLQLQFLKHESRDACDDVSDASSFEDTGEIFPQKFGGDFDKEFYYALDMLTLSGLNDDSLDSSSAVCHLPESPVGPEIFEKLEKLYGGQARWTKVERKLLFDFTNTIINNFFLPLEDQHVWMKPSRRAALMQGQKLLVEDVWKLLVEKRKDLSSEQSADCLLDMNWLSPGEHTYTIAKEMEKVLGDELIEELVLELKFRCFQR